ncbi:hypothetical protein VitviT2T_001852 [Vitis vinifera]|uniref:Neprosin activation peptide domain-containing protein n=1 Tax=Vitis vinifera TaxID=29760 RepID=A0ABY9BHC5_VITVI|nr:hypothetical protein VitviT2T_001852 [Vitis vinifera]
MAAFLVFELGGVGGDTSTEEDMELERQLKFLNKPARKSFQDLDGSIYDCVDIDKQPALDHPLLKNNKIQMEPPSPPKEVINGNQASRSFVEPVGIGIKGAECPTRNSHHQKNPKGRSNMGKKTI